METYRLEFSVRDYECDIQGIVNNANYQHYLEHARHEYIKTLGLNFTELHEQGVDMVVAKLEMAFKTPLKSNDRFIVTVTMKKEGIRWIFLQDIQRLPDLKLAVRARVDAVAVVNGKLTDYKPLDVAFGINQ
jgi:acyl-CoA thioester hydrolase